MRASFPDSRAGSSFRSQKLAHCFDTDDPLTQTFLVLDSTKSGIGETGVVTHDRVVPRFSRKRLAVCRLEPSLSEALYHGLVYVSNYTSRSLVSVSIPRNSSTHPPVRPLVSTTLTRSHDRSPDPCTSRKPSQCPAAFYAAQYCQTRRSISIHDHQPT